MQHLTDFRRYALIAALIEATAHWRTAVEKSLDIAATYRHMQDLTNDLAGRSRKGRRLGQLEIGLAVDGWLPRIRAEELVEIRNEIAGLPRWSVKRVDDHKYVPVDLGFVLRQGSHGATGNGVTVLRSVRPSQAQAVELLVAELVGDAVWLTRTTIGGPSTVLYKRLSKTQYEAAIESHRAKAGRGDEAPAVQVLVDSHLQLLDAVELAAIATRGKAGPEIEVPDRSEIEEELARRGIAGGEPSHQLFGIAREQGLLTARQYLAAKDWLRDLRRWGDEQ